MKTTLFINALTTEQLFQQVLWDRDDLKNCDSKIPHLQDLHLNYEAMIEQLFFFLSTSKLLDRLEELGELHLALRTAESL